MMLTKQYVVLIAVILLGSLALYQGILSHISDNLAIPNMSTLIGKYEKDLENGEYKKIPVQHIFGSDGIFQILEENGSVIYQSDAGMPTSWTEGELWCIPEAESYERRSATSFINEAGITETIITAEKYSADTGMESDIRDFIILDEELKVISSSIPLNKNQFTRQELEYIQGKLGEEHQIGKYRFKDTSGNQRILVFRSPVVGNDAYDKALSLMKHYWLMLIPFYSLVIVLAIIWLNHQISKPLKLLEYHLSNFTKERPKEPVSYTGPREFCEIIESFNIMSEELLESEQKRQSLDEEKQRMLADISHDLKTPITVIQGYSKAICDGIVSEDKKEQYLNTIYQKSNVLNELIHAFYDYSKLEHPGFKLSLETVDFSEYVRSYLAGKYNEIDVAGFDMDVDIPEDGCLCEMDQMQFGRVLENLIINALKHNPKGTCLYFRVFEEKDSVKLIVADDGQGIPTQIAGHIFEPFVVGDASRNSKQGTGLGLAITKKIIDAHGGEIELIMQPEKNYRTEFLITMKKKSV